MEEQMSKIKKKKTLTKDQEDIIITFFENRYDGVDEYVKLYLDELFNLCKYVIDSESEKAVSGSLPTDEEIEKWAFDKCDEVEDSRWFQPLIEGAKWMRKKVQKFNRQRS